ncbi:MAG: sulfide/dihydroorotate dehydrogenase-like FAD/NAD-binding protein [Candidatus Methanoliparum thermophilum]|uniref:Sulfide/dihydroorotate dehydrogenase-like FAD/NAD-binding protein n=1 Tax=Methanoliparum thermophilum TaxID=2491083 RepID=A0A520KSF2_METT2|nr:sulfide/dihydroorotate dehydrogenase-like FAD/NAD-binding protein [Candidatus Methanoliparum sp. LAM-1]RZN64533.1 MAG: sulfide/dihydroorotate dehydrogenase-like FAD/NAD-binding protein [Candidatus Methanoliparum thermophilum]BDC35869.1 ferredoxin-NADP+ reductase subunit alpha [Candidatus Methanoliparum sp. LAM-1]
MKNYDIKKRKTLAENIKLFEIEAPLIAKNAKPGNFVILRIDDHGERIPVTITDSDVENGTITIVVQEVGKTTKKLGMLNEGDKILDVVGPLGRETEIKNYGTVVCIGGGVGIALIYPEIKAFKKAGNYVISIVGSRTKDLMIFEEEISKMSDEFYITTDDGTKGRKGFVSDVLKELIDDGKKIDIVMAVGPIIMMKVVADVTRPYGIKTIVSLNPIMIDGTGMCGGCRVQVGGNTMFACVDGPDFDAHQVDFDNLIARNKRFLEEEKVSLEGLKNG